MRVAIYGAGGVGGYFGGRLAEAGEEVVFIARSATLQALQTNGLKVDSIKGDFTVHPVHASDNPTAVGVVDVVLICVKAWQIPTIAPNIRPLIGPDTLVVPLQNGVDAPAQLAKELGGEHVIGGLCGLISFVAEPGYICHVGAEPFIKFGELDNHVSDRVKELHKAFMQTVGVAAEIPDDIQVAMWHKFLLIASWSGIGAITRVPLGAFLGLPQTRQLLRGVMQEIFSVAHARGIALREEVIRNTLDFMDSLPPTGTASMQRDIMEGRHSELESQTGAVFRMGQEVGIKTPINTFIYNSLLPQELKAQGQLDS